MKVCSDEHLDFTQNLSISKPSTTSTNCYNMNKYDFTESAIKCLLKLLPEDTMIDNSEIFSDVKHTVIVSSFTTLMMCAAHIENLCYATPSLQPVKISIKANTIPQNKAESTHDSDEVILYESNPSATDTEVEPQSEHFPITTAPGVNDIIPVSATHTTPNQQNVFPGNIPPSSNPDLQFNNKKVMPPMLTTGDFISGSGSECYRIRDLTSKTCMWFLLDGMGLTTHCEPNRAMGSEQLHVKFLRKVVQDIYTLERIHRKNRGESRTVQTITYRDLFPKELQRGQFFIRFPILSLLSSDSHGSVTKIVDMKPFPKSSEMTKDQMFCLICTLYQTQSDPSSCQEVLHSVSKEGKGSVGCVRMKNYGKGYSFYSSDCNDDCHGVASAGATLLSQDGLPVAKAICFPLISSLAGNKLANGLIAAHIFRIISGEHIKYPNMYKKYLIRNDSPDFNLDVINLDETLCRGNILVWEKKNIRKVILLGEQKQHVASAILASRIHIPIPRRSRESTTELARIPESLIIVTDIVVDEGCGADEPYPFTEWYTTGLLKSLRSSHICIGGVPQMINDITSSNCPALVWDKQKITEIAPDNPDNDNNSVL